MISKLTTAQVVHSILRHSLLCQWNSTRDKWQIKEWVGGLVVSRQIGGAGQREHVSVEPEGGTVAHH